MSFHLSRQIVITWERDVRHITHPVAEVTDCRAREKQNLSRPTIWCFLFNRSRLKCMYTFRVSCMNIEIAGAKIRARRRRAEGGEAKGKRRKRRRDFVAISQAVCAHLPWVSLHFSRIRCRSSWEILSPRDTLLVFSTCSRGPYEHLIARTCVIYAAKNAGTPCSVCTRRYRDREPVRCPMDDQMARRCEQFWQKWRDTAVTVAIWASRIVCLMIDRGSDSLSFEKVIFEVRMILNIPCCRTLGLLQSARNLSTHVLIFWGLLYKRY